MFCTACRISAIDPVCGAAIFGDGKGRSYYQRQPDYLSRGADLLVFLTLGLAQVSQLCRLVSPEVLDIFNTGSIGKAG